ncbi:MULTISPECIES: hypothetical protein [Deinococcus]|uniref:Uncharacterized protein n=1 Tax=Deinococcus rufus TaxID=2136097 RepID=A0ABV7ZB94_9DEIO|nr:hypothetical protein [Deinococcus sp. AB2017081]WQE94982.1 hypothetical protein U2P90_16560 [Deinococcus sp. AB2017081]
MTSISDAPVLYPGNRNCPLAQGRVNPDAAAILPVLPIKPGIHILRRPPGHKKSVHTRQAVIKELKSGRRKRVLWAVHSTIGEHALAREAVEQFEQAGVACTLVKGKKHTLGMPEYVRQLEWSDKPEVKVISFAHLAHIYDRHGLLRALKADLLVIDEFPLSGLVQDQQIRLPNLETFGRHSAICARLAQVLGTPPPATVQAPTDVRRLAEQHYFTGSAFLQAIGSHWRDSDWAAFEEQLRTLSPYLTDDWFGAFRNDVAHPERNHYRFGLSWNILRSGGIQAPRFYGHVLLPLHGLPPTLILDAYADETLYGAVFPGHLIHPIEPSEDGRPLEVQVAPELHLDDLNMVKPTQFAKCLHIAEEVLQHQRDRQITIITSKAQRDPEGPWMRALSEAAVYHGITTMPLYLHHYAGRGLNTFEGTTLFMLKQPRLPLRHSLGTMAALYPDDAEARQRTQDWLEDSEHLQLMHRSRQAIYPEQCECRPRIILGYWPRPSLIERGCKVTPYVPKLSFTWRSRHPRWRDAVLCLAEEMESTLGGVFSSVYAVLGLLKHRRGDPDKAEESLRRHRAALAEALHRTPPPLGSELDHWLRHGTLRRFRDVQAFAKPASPLDDLLRAAGFGTGSVERRKVAAGHSLSTKVWIRPGVDARAMFEQVYR